MCNDCTVIYCDGNFKDKLKKQKALEREMIKKFGRNKPNDFRYKLCILDNCIMAEHIPEIYLKENYCQTP